MSFGIFESALSSEQEVGIAKQAAVDKREAAIYDVREKLGPSLFASRDLTEFRDRVAMMKNDQSVYKIIGEHIHPSTGVVRSIVGKNGALEKEFKAHQAALKAAGYLRTGWEDPRFDAGMGGTGVPAPETTGPGSDVGVGSPLPGDWTSGGGVGKPLPDQPSERMSYLRDAASGTMPIQGSLFRGGPFAGYKDFDACTAANSDKNDPDAYCGKIKHQVEGNIRQASAIKLSVRDHRALQAELMRLAGDTSQGPSPGSKAADYPIEGTSYMGVPTSTTQMGTADLFGQHDTGTGAYGPHGLPGGPGSENPPPSQSPSNAPPGGSTSTTRGGSRRRADFEGTVDTDQTFSPSSGPLTPSPDFVEYLQSVDQDAPEKVDRNFTSARTAWAVYTDWCQANNLHPGRMASLDAYSSNLTDAQYFRLAQLRQAWEFSHQPKTPKGQGKSKLQDVTARRRYADDPGFGQKNEPGSGEYHSPYTPNPSEGQWPALPPTEPTRGASRRAAGKHGPYGDDDDADYWGTRVSDPPELHRGDADYGDPQTSVKSELFKPKRHRKPQHEGRRDPLHAYVAWCKANGFKRISARNVSIFAGNDPQLAYHLALRMKKAIRVARHRQAGEHDLEKSYGNQYGPKRQRNPYDPDDAGPTINTEAGPRWPSPESKRPGRHRAEASRRYAQPDYLQKADDALTQLLNQKAEEFQQTIAPLQQALTTVQQAEQIQQAQNPMNVLPPPGTVNVMPGGDQGPAGMPAPGAEDLGGAAAALAGGPPPGGPEGGAPEGAPPPGADQGAPGGGGPPPEGGGGGLPPELAQMMQANRRRGGYPKGRGAARSLTGTSVFDLWKKYQQSAPTLRGDESDYEGFASQYGVGGKALNKLKQHHQQSGGPTTLARRQGGMDRKALAQLLPLLLRALPMAAQAAGVADMAGGAANSASDLMSKYGPPDTPPTEVMPDDDERTGSRRRACKMCHSKPSSEKCHACKAREHNARLRYLGWCRRHRLRAASTRNFYWYLGQMPREARLLSAEYVPEWQQNKGRHDYKGRDRDQDQIFFPQRGRGWEHGSGPEGPPYVREQVGPGKHRKSRRKRAYSDDQFEAEYPGGTSDDFNSPAAGYEYHDPTQQNGWKMTHSDDYGHAAWQHPSGHSISGTDGPDGGAWQLYHPTGQPMGKPFKDPIHAQEAVRRHLQGHRKLAWSGWGPALFPKTRQVTGWDWNNHLNGYIANRPQRFACECGDSFPTPSGFQRCACGKQWNSYVIGTGGTNHEAAAEKFLVREIPVRDDVIVANRQLTASPDFSYRPPYPETQEGLNRGIKHQISKDEHKQKMLEARGRRTTERLVAQGRLPKKYLDPNYTAGRRRQGAGTFGHDYGEEFVNRGRDIQQNPENHPHRWHDVDEELHSMSGVPAQLREEDEEMGVDHYHPDPQFSGRKPGRHPRQQEAEPGSRWATMHNVTDPGQLGEGMDDGRATMSKPPSDWHSRGDGARWVGSPIGR